MTKNASEHKTLGQQTQDHDTTSQCSEAQLRMDQAKCAFSAFC